MYNRPVPRGLASSKRYSKRRSAALCAEALLLWEPPGQDGPGLLGPKGLRRPLAHSADYLQRFRGIDLLQHFQRPENPQSLRGGGQLLEQLFQTLAALQGNLAVQLAAQGSFRGLPQLLQGLEGFVPHAELG